MPASLSPTPVGSPSGRCSAPASSSRSSSLLGLPLGKAFAVLLLGTLLGLGALPADAARGKNKEADASAEAKDDSPWNAATFRGLGLRNIGPALMSGRVSDLAIHPDDQSTWYVAVGSGGVWKTTNAGTTWTPIFDDQGSYSIGVVALDPSRPETVWVGTGENVSGRHVGYGDGVYRSLDGGRSWKKLGLEESGHIGSISIDPRDSNTVLVAAQGLQWAPGGERGVYRTTDGGETWEQVLAAGEYTGANEVVRDPSNPDVVYAALHQRHRTVAALINGGPESGIHKSTDGGVTWRELTTGLPGEDMGKIGLAVSPLNSKVLYATVELARRDGGFYRSADGGETWEKRNDYISGGTGPHYYQELFASPHVFDRVYQMDVRIHWTDDGGRNFTQLPHEFKHSDNHAMAFDPNDPDYLLVGCDGGIYESWDHGATWKFVANLPVTQFYKVAVDVDEPFYNIYGGTQDNNTQGGPSRTWNVHGIRNSDWFITLFGDGHQPATDPSNPDIVYSEWQQGNLVRYDRKTGEIVYIQPQGEPGDPPERFNWDAPILVSPHDPARLYFASQRVWRSDDRGDSWRPVSEDLSRGQRRLEMPMMGRTWSIDAVWDLFAMSQFATVTSLSESPQVEGLLYAGTDDGLIRVSEDGGENWRQAGALPGVPEDAFVNDVKADLHDADTVYVALDNHKNGDFRPFLLKSTDRGQTWSSIASDLPERHLVWRLVQDHEVPELLFVGTEFGVFFSRDGGGRWIELTGGVPQISFRDLAIQQRENDLVGATFGRGFFIFDDYSPLRLVDDALLDGDAALFPVKDALWYIQRQTLGSDEKASQGDAFYTAPNPPFGATFTYYLKEGLESREAARKKSEAELAKEGQDVPFAGWDALREEAREEDPAIVLTVRDSAGAVVRRITGPAAKGFHRVSWDLRHPSMAAWSPRGGGGGFFGNDGFLASPGTYRVELAKRVDGALTPLAEPQSFEVVPITEGALPGASPAEVGAFLRRLETLQRRINAANALLGATEQRIGAIRSTLMASTAEDGLLAEAHTLSNQLTDLGEQLRGDRLRQGYSEPTEPSAQGRMFTAIIGNSFSTYGPTPMHLRQVELAEGQLSEVETALEAFVAELPEFERKLDAAGVPWTPGRSIP